MADYSREEQLRWRWVDGPFQYGDSHEARQAIYWLLGELARLRTEAHQLRLALLGHRADLHNYSKRPCPTCRFSAKVLGIAGRVPDCCSLADTDGTTMSDRGDVIGNKLGALAGAVGPAGHGGGE